MNRNLYLDLHILQTVPPSCVNRDDTGSPKTAVYGGVTRARVSSQAWKRAVRESFRENRMFTANQLGERTKHIVNMVAEKIRVIDPSMDAEKLAVNALNLAIGTAKKKEPIKSKESEEGTGALFFLGNREAEELAKLAVSKERDAKKYKAVLTPSAFPSVEVVLFGRMVADDPTLKYDAAAQVAHSISTHAVHNEYDYFTAVDDCAPEDNTGAAHLGTVEFNSSTLYRYATVNIRELAEHLGADTPAAVRCFTEAFILSMPKGRQHPFAHRTTPDFVYAALRTDQPVNLCGAFEKPVSAGKTGYVEPSVDALIRYAEKRVYAAFVPAPADAWAVGGFPVPEGFAAVEPLSELLPDVERRVEAALGGGVD